MKTNIYKRKPVSTLHNICKSSVTLNSVYVYLKKNSNWSHWFNNFFLFSLLNRLLSVLYCILCHLLKFIAFKNRAPPFFYMLLASCVFFFPYIFLLTFLSVCNSRWDSDHDGKFDKSSHVELLTAPCGKVFSPGLKSFYIYICMYVLVIYICTYVAGNK